MPHKGLDQLPAVHVPRARRGIQALCQQASLILSLLLFILVKARQQQLIDLGGVGPLDGLLFCDQAFIDHVYENFDGGCGTALA